MPAPLLRTGKLQETKFEFLYKHFLESNIKEDIQFPNFVTASSTAVLVQLTPLLGALVGVVATLFLVAICIVIFVKFRSKVSEIASVSL